MVQSNLTALNSISQQLGLETGTSITISNSAPNNAITASNGVLDKFGNRVFTVTSTSFPNGTFTINGGPNDFVVLNFGGFSPQLNGRIVLSGGITSDQVLLNITPDPTNLTAYNNAYTTLSGGPTLNFNTNDTTLGTSGIFLDPTSSVSVNHALVLGHVFGGDTSNMQIVSQASITAPNGGSGGTGVPSIGTPLEVIPAPPSVVLLGLGGLCSGRRSGPFAPAACGGLISPR
jgi:hypothetical protein